MCKYRELSFEWSHHRILCTDWKVRFTLQNSIKHSGSERVFKGNCKIYICHYFCFCHYFLLLMVIKNRKNWHCIYNEWPQRNDLLKKSRHEDKQCTVSSGIRDLRLLQTPSLLTNRLFMFQSYSTQNVILYFDEQWPGVYPHPGMVRHKMLLFHLISFSIIVDAVVLLFLSSSVTTLQGSPLTICCAYRLLLRRYTLPLKTETSRVEFSHLNFLQGHPTRI